MRGHQRTDQAEEATHCHNCRLQPLLQSNWRHKHPAGRSAVLKCGQPEEAAAAADELPPQEAAAAAAEEPPWWWHLPFSSP